MPETYFGGAPNAFLGGVEFAAAQRRRRANDNALAALIQRFGPEAADPVALGQLQGIEQRTELHPLAVQQQKQTIAANEEALQQARRDQLMKAGQNAAFFLERAKQGGMDLGQAFDRVATILPSFGVSTDQLQGIREQIVSNPDTVDELVAMFRGGTATRATGAPVPVYDQSGNLRLMQHFSDGTTKVIEGLTPAAALQGEARLQQGAERLGLGWSNLNWDQVKEYLPSREQGVQLFPREDGRVVADIVPGSPAERALEQSLQEMTANDRKLLQSYNTISSRAGVLQTNVQRALDYFSSAEGGLLLQNIRRGAPLVPGTAMYNAWDALETIKNNIGIEELQQMRQSSPTGGAMGNVSDKDIEILTGTKGRLSQVRDPQRLIEDLQNIAEIYGRVVGFAEEDARNAQYRSQLRDQRRGASFGPQPRPTLTGGGAQPRSSDELSDEELLQRYLR